MKIFYKLIFLFYLTGYVNAQSIPAPERVADFDLIHIKMHITPVWNDKSVSGKVTTTFTPKADGFKTIELDAIAFDIKSINGSQENNLNFVYDGTKLKIELDKPHRRDDTIAFTIDYTCKPQRGFYFVYPTELDLSHPYQIWTQGQSEDNKHWIPIHDYPNNKATTEMYIALPEGMKSISNGYYAGSKILPDGKVEHHWKQDEPHSTYLIMVGGGDHYIIEDSFGEIPIQSYVTKDKIETGEYTFRNTPAMMDLFIRKFGEYPFANYKQVVVKDFIYGGMENTTATVLNERVYYTPDIELDYSGDGLISHELGHMWWGDNTTCREWSELWLNESFATYSNAIWNKEFNGDDAYDFEILRYMDNSMRVDSARGRYSIWGGRGALSENTYGKGAAILNTMKYVIGEENFYNTLRNFQSKFAFQNVVTQDLIDVMNETVNEGRSGGQPLFDYTWMFNQWIYKAGYPELNVFYDIPADGNFVNVVVKQVQREDSLTPVFRMPVDILIKYKDSEVIHNVTLSQREDKFSFPLSSQPEYIIFDTGNRYIKKLYTNAPLDMLLKQITFADKSIDKIAGIRQLNTLLHFTHMPDETRKQINDRQAAFFEFYDTIMDGDFYQGVKSELVDIIPNYPPDVAFSYLKKRYETENNSIVKRRILKAIGKTKHLEAADYIYSKIQNEQNTYVIAEGIEAITTCSDESKLYSYLTPFIKMDSHRNMISNEVIKGLSKLSGENVKQDLIGFAFGIDIDGRVRAEAVNKLVPYAEDEKVKELAMKYFDWNFRMMKLALVNLLGHSKDEAVKKFLEQKKSGITDEAITRAIDNAVTKISSGD